MSAPADCIFCKIVRGEIPAAKVFESDAVIAFLDIQPAAPGHLLIVPKSHHTSLLDTPDAVARELGAVLPRLVRAVRTATDAPALNVIANTGREAGQSVDHVHFHLIPRRAGDSVQIRLSGRAYGAGEQETVRKRIAALVDQS
jgi:histidine triad (HIT) family protein